MLPNDEVQNERQNLCTNFLGTNDVDERSGRVGKRMKWTGRNHFYITVVGKTK
jgi:hypothetical protein